MGNIISQAYINRHFPPNRNSKRDSDEVFSVIKHGFSASSQGYIWAELTRGQPIIVECERIYIRSSTLYAGGRVGAFFDLEDLAILAAREGLRFAIAASRTN